MGNASLRAEVAKAARFRDHVDKKSLQAMLVDAKDNGEIHMASPKRECFTFSLWLTMHGVTDPDRRRGAARGGDFLP
jgi:hypothetical protein